MQKSPPDVDVESSRVSCKIGVLKQSQSALFGSVSHTTILPVLTCVMNVRGQTCQTLVASFLSILWPLEQVWVSPLRAKYRHFRTICEQAVDTTPTDRVSSSLNWWSIILAWRCDFVQLLSCFVRQFEMSFHANLCMAFHIIGPRRYCFCIRFPWSSQRESQISKDIMANCRDMFESRISAGAKEKLPTRASHTYVVKKWCWFSQVDVFHSHLPHWVDVLSLSSQFDIVHIDKNMAFQWWGILTCIFPSDGPFFSRILAWRSVDRVNCTRRIVPKDFLHRDWVSRACLPLSETNASDPCETQPKQQLQHLCLRFLFLSGIVALLRLFIRLFVNLVKREQALIPGFTTRLCEKEVTFGRKCILTRRSRTSTLQKSSARLSKNHTRITFASDTSLPRHTSTSCHWWLRRCGGFRCRFLCTIVALMPETALVSLRTLAFFFPLVTGTFSSFNATQSLTILHHCCCFNSPVSGVKVS